MSVCHRNWWLWWIQRRKKKNQRRSAGCRRTSQMKRWLWGTNGLSSVRRAARESNISSDFKSLAGVVLWCHRAVTWWDRRGQRCVFKLEFFASDRMFLLLQVWEFSRKHEEEVCKEASEISDRRRRRQPQRCRNQHKASVPEASGLILLCHRQNTFYRVSAAEQQHSALKLVGCYTSDFFFFKRETCVFETLTEFLLYRMDKAALNPQLSELVCLSVL